MKRLLIISAALLLNRADAQWISNGPDSQTIACLVASGSNIFAGTDYKHGLFLSTDNGANWTVPVSPLTDTTIPSLSLSGANIFAGAYPNGIFLSTDNGSTWAAADSGLSNTPIYSLGVNGSNIYAGGNGHVFLSTDNGAYWRSADSGIRATVVTSFAFSGSNIFAGTDSGVYLSTNNGANWISVNTGLTFINVQALAVSGACIFAGTWGGGVYLSVNNGSYWTPVNIGLSSTSVNALAITGTTIFAATIDGLLLSTDSGTTWMEAGLAGDINSLALNGSTIFAGLYAKGVWQRPLSDFPTGIQQISLPSSPFHLYPNPTNNNFIIETSNTGEQQLQVFDITGKLLLTRAIQNNKTTIDASSFAAGIYLVSLKGSEGTATQKLVIEK